MPAIELRGVGKRFGDAWAVRDLDLTIETGETFVLVGASGCGKTTTLRMINRLEVPSTGTVTVLGQDTARVDGPQLRRSIGYVIQQDGLFAHLDVRANVSVVPRLLGWNEAQTRARVDELLERVGLPASRYAGRFPAELSGGQRQRVGIARALAADPPIVLLDEPFGALDPVTRERMQDEFVALARELDKTYVFVTHDMREAVRLADRIAVMEDGRLIRCATPTELLREPGDETVAALLGGQRVQLRLMTMRLGDLAASSEAPDDADTAVELSGQDTVWDALTACERERASCVVVDGRWVSREALAAIVLPSKTRV